MGTKLGSMNPFVVLLKVLLFSVFATFAILGITIGIKWHETSNVASSANTTALTALAAAQAASTAAEAASSAAQTASAAAEAASSVASSASTTAAAATEAIQDLPSAFSQYAASIKVVVSNGTSQGTDATQFVIDALLDTTGWAAGATWTSSAQRTGLYTFTLPPDSTDNVMSTAVSVLPSFNEVNGTQVYCDIVKKPLTKSIDFWFFTPCESGGGGCGVDVANAANIGRFDVVIQKLLAQQPQ